MGYSLAGFWMQIKKGTEAGSLIFLTTYWVHYQFLGEGAKVCGEN
jgi:hypothetical protein